MGQLMAQGALIGVVAALSVATTLTSILNNRSSLRTVVYVFALKSGMGGVDNEAHLKKVVLTAPASLLQDGRQGDYLDRDKWRRKTRGESVPAVWKHEAAFQCHEMVPWARALIQASVDSDLEDTYYHVPRAVFIQKSTSPLTLRAGLHVEDILDTSAPADYHRRCHPQCPVRLRLLSPEPDRLWPRNLVVAECACKETPCSSRGRYQCRQVNTPVLIVRGLPGQRPRYCIEMVPAGCRCVPVRTGQASSFEPFAIT